VTRRGLLAVAGALLLIVGLLVVVRADDGLQRERVVVDGVPVTALRPTGAGPFPGVVVAHGFSGSARLMDGIGIAFARAGWVAALPDLSGHGASTASLTDAPLADEVLAVADWLEERDDVDDIGLLGHSMGAGAVTEAAATRPELPVVALSLPSAEQLASDLDAVFLVGSAEPARFGETARAAAELGYETVTIDGAEHISILFRTQTLQTAVSWLDDAVGRRSAPVAPDWRMAGVAAAYLGSALLFWPLSAWVVRGRADGRRGRGSRVPVWVGVPVAGLVAGGVLAVLPALADVVPLLVGGYLAAFFALSGAVTWLLARRWERPSPSPAVSGVVLGLYAGVSIGVPAQLAWAEVSLTGARAAAFVGLLVAVGAFAWAEGLLAARPSYGAVLGGRLLLAAVLAGLAFVGSAPGFLVLLVPLVAVILPWFGAYGVRVTQLSGSALAGALSQAPPLALLVAITTPLA
jgi:hypothetical protein